MPALEQRALLEWTMSIVNFDNVSIWSELPSTTQFDVIFAVILGESPFQTLQDLLTSSELELSTTDSLNDVRLMRVFGSHRD